MGGAADRASAVRGSGTGRCRGSDRPGTLIGVAALGAVSTDYAGHDPAGGYIQPLVDLVDTHGTTTILRAIDQLDDEHTVEVTVCTAHKAKGREWPRVRIADDFTPPPGSEEHDDKGQPLPGPVDDGEAGLAYAAVTRARNRLDIGGRAWINHHPDGSPA
ncbi:hypothetical protein [Streptomyces sp. Ncost-T10-10d]|uniref:hypothetical protein n=1 Tax=Streptomyces sp. Ncost-T10-10d TaxID=1839774 RepID=UPI00081F2FBD|nr:UvrD-like helicase C-terminal domain-containing protein [Streptomyces sp. Ncost-T10-10d]